MKKVRLPPLKSLHAFRYAAQSLSFKNAAEQLNVSQAAISQQIKTLEQSLGLELFERHTRQVILTTEGEYLFDYVVQGFDLLEQGVRGIIEDPNPNKLVISTLPSFASRWLVARLGDFQAQEKEINIQLSPSLVVASFQDQELDLSIRFGQGKYDGLKTELLFEEMLIPICHPSLIDTNKAIKPQLAKLPIIADNGPDMNAIWPLFQQYIGCEDEQMPSRLQVSDSTVLIEALLSCQGISMIRYSLVYELMQKGQLISPLPLYMKSQYNFYLVAPAPHFKYDKVVRFRHWLKHEVKVIKKSWQTYYEQTSGLYEVVYEAGHAQ
jgi:LysR family glycine cleavage system transcriptional activator